MFRLRLAKEFGFANVDDLLNYISAEQLDEWWVYYQIEPWGYEIETRRIGTATATLANFIGQIPLEKALTHRDIFPESFEQTQLTEPSEEAAASLGVALKLLNG